MDAVVIGAGPAGWAAAAALRKEGARVVLVAPAPEAPWIPTYCVWVDEVPAYREELAEQWPGVTVQFGDEARRIERPYARFDNARLAARLRRDANGTEVWSGVIESVQTEGERLVVHLNDGRARTTDYVIDCSGAASTLVRREEGPEPAVQTAIGRVIRRGVDADVLPTLMDFRPVDDAEPVSFVYILPFSDGTVLVEETVLAARPAVPPDRLEARLDRRLQKLGWADDEVLETERVYIPMGAPLPVAEQPVVAFGAAASMVHPATGYLVGYVLRHAPALARGLARGASEPDPLRRAAKGNAAVWPRGLRRTRALHELGLEVLLGLSPAQIAAFFEAFFETPQWAWSAYLKVDAPVSRIALSMASSFGRMDADCRGRIQAAIRARGFVQVGRSVWAA